MCPGPVNTTFGEHALSGKIPARVMKLRRLVSVSPDQVAQAIIRAVETTERIAYIPLMARAFMAVDFFFFRAMDWHLRRQW